MVNENKSRPQAMKWIRWIARIWSLPIILFIGLTFIGYAWSWITTGTADPYAVGTPSPLEAVPPVLMFLGVLGLAIAWRWEGLGGAVDLFFQLAVIIMLLFTKPLSSSAIPYTLALLTAAPGVLFLFYWWRARAMTSTPKGA